MSAADLSSTEHSLLLFRVDFLPTEEAQAVREKLSQAYGCYLDALAHLQRTCRNYEAIADCIRSKVPIKDSERALICAYDEI